VLPSIMIEVEGQLEIPACVLQGGHCFTAVPCSHTAQHAMVTFSVASAAD
jgi:hypothetical protein